MLPVEEVCDLFNLFHTTHSSIYSSTHISAINFVSMGGLEMTFNKTKLFNVLLSVCIVILGIIIQYHRNNSCLYPVC